MISPTGIMPEYLIQRGMRRQAFEWLLAQPWPADHKLQVWGGWRAVTGALFDRGEYDMLANSGRG